MTTSRVHITPHMHWDREWYFTTEESRILLINNMEEIMCRSCQQIYMVPTITLI